MQYSNEDSDIKYSHLIAGATLTGRMNRNSFQTALATIEVTNQCSKRSYHNYQNHMYKPIIESAKQSSKTILLEILDHLKEIYLLKQEKVLPIGFDCSWSYSRNAHQASYNYQPVIAFHTIENSRSVKYDDSSKIVHKENFNGTSRQMEHAILFALLNDIMPILKETDFTLHICVDGNLETNKTLACILAVSRIFADLKHVSKNIQKNLNDAPTEEETRYVQVEGLIRHLLDDHTEIDNFRNVITTIFRIPVGQGIVTTFRTSHNETFNKKILKYLNKRIDYWASYSAQHVLAVIDQNDGLDAMISKVRVVATGVDFSYSDICNILKFVQERSRQVIKNRSAIQQKNEARKEQYVSERKELAGFDFDKELVSYKSKVSEQIHENIFWPSFGELLTDFDVIVKCVACHAFAKKSSRAVCSEGLTIVFSPLKVLIEDQKQELVKAGISCAVLYANLTQGTRIQEKIFEEIASGLIKVLFVTPEKLKSLTGISINYFHGGLHDNERETVMNNWKFNHTQIIVATSAFRMGINLNNILVVIYAEVPISITNLIQEAERAGRDGNTATHVIFFSKKDIHTNYSIIAEYRET
ncbi:putative sgs1 protein [Rhizophagus irregularis DAOM 181602=DAOM 197198]|nr:putative sgs1 protein [Rhizophagus irregularis DAOM 181602=DAOM 197198]